MKQLVCEMCGGTDWAKEDGMFVCQGCGMKYSAEEAKKMMTEVEGTPTSVSVKNAAQLENLLNLAQSSYDSKNYAQAEAFCNQVIAMDSTNFDAWLLKGRAINYQINAKNQRILEVYNCIMTAYQVLDDAGKKKNAKGILSILKTCFEGEVDFWLQQFEAARPSDATLLRAKNAYVEAYNKMADAYIEMGLKKEKAAYLSALDNFFIKKANTTCVSAWKTTVAYNYYRDDLGTLGKNWGTGNAWSRLVTTNTDLYRPMKETWKTFITEGDCLIEMLQFAEEQFNDDTPFETKKNVFENIAYFEEQLAKACWYKIGVEADRVGWLADGSLTYEAKRIRNKRAQEYRQRVKEEKANEVSKRRNAAIAESKDEDADMLLVKVQLDLIENRNIEAEARFDLFIQKCPNNPIGYVGKAIAFCRNNGDEIKTLALLKKAIPYRVDNEEDKEELLTWVDYDVKNGLTLLMIAAANLDYDAVKYLIDCGTDVNQKSHKNVSALWFVCHKRYDGDDAPAARKIAQLLLANGADVNVTNAGNVALYNKDTDGQIAAMIKQKFPNAVPGAAAAKKKSGGCYVATAVYGSYDCPQVWTLRRYRDDTLAATWYGRAFIHTYYAVSPTLVKWFGETQWFKNMWRGKLDRMVADLQQKGVESTPYNDRVW